MKRFAKAHDFPFPYLHDETQTVVRAYGAVCTPDFFGYNADRRLKYRGRLDEGRTTSPRAEAPRELVAGWSDPVAVVVRVLRFCEALGRATRLGGSASGAVIVTGGS